MMTSAESEGYYSNAALSAKPLECYMKEWAMDNHLGSSLIMDLRLTL